MRVEWEMLREAITIHSYDVDSKVRTLLIILIENALGIKIDLIRVRLRTKKDNPYA